MVLKTCTCHAQPFQEMVNFDLEQVLVEHLRQRCLDEPITRGRDSAKHYSVLNQAPREWEEDDNKPCGGERYPLYLLFFQSAASMLHANP